MQARATSKKGDRQRVARFEVRTLFQVVYSAITAIIVMERVLTRCDGGGHSGPREGIKR